MKNILVVGGCGFVGSNLCDHLLKQGYLVTSLDNYFTGTTHNHINGVRYFKNESKDILNINFETDFDTVFHLGEYSRVEQSFDDIDVVFEYNMQSIYSVLKYCRNNKSKLIYSGSSTKFGDDGECGDSSPYAWTKKTNADLVRVYSSWFDLDYAITYFYNVYGPREISDGAYSTLIAKYLNLVKSGQSKLPVVRPGTQIRNFTHVDDIVRGLVLVALNGHGDGFGIGNDQGYTILELVKLLGKDIEWLPERKGNRMVAPVNSSLTTKLGWSCKNDLASYLTSETDK